MSKCMIHGSATYSSTTKKYPYLKNLWYLVTLFRITMQCFLAFELFHLSLQAAAYVSSITTKGFFFFQNTPHPLCRLGSMKNLQ